MEMGSHKTGTPNFRLYFFGCIDADAETPAPFFLFRAIPSGGASDLHDRESFEKEAKIAVARR